MVNYDSRYVNKDLFSGLHQKYSISSGLKGRCCSPCWIDSTAKRSYRGTLPTRFDQSCFRQMEESTSNLLFRKGENRLQRDWCVFHFSHEVRTTKYYLPDSQIFSSIILEALNIGLLKIDPRDVFIRNSGMGKQI